MSSIPLENGGASLFFPLCTSGGIGSMLRDLHSVLHYGFSQTPPLKFRGLSFWTVAIRKQFFNKVIPFCGKNILSLKMFPRKINKGSPFCGTSFPQKGNPLLKKIGRKKVREK